MVVTPRVWAAAIWPKGASPEVVAPGARFMPDACEQGDNEVVTPQLSESTKELVKVACGCASHPTLSPPPAAASGTRQQLERCLLMAKAEGADAI